MEYVNATQVSPLVSHVQIKVCYVGQDPNRNGTVITRETADKFAKNLPGCPIVGYYNEKTKDFDAHNREVVVEDGKFKLIDMTRPYGFVDVNAHVWFQTFIDDGVEHEYLCTEGYIWTGVYEESQRVIDKGNNQSMELSEKYEKGFWTEDSNSGKNIFIINDGLIEKLCILGSDVEPCFEGAQIKSFSLTSPEFTEFKSTMFSMINELKDALNKGGPENTMENEKNNPQAQVQEPTDTPTPEYQKKEEMEKEKKENPSEKEDKKENEPSKQEDKNNEEEDKKKKDKNYNLNDIAEYVSLQLQFNELQGKYSALEKEHQTLTAEVEQLRTFKLAANRKEKEDMIASFYMLSDADKKDVIDHIDTYSLNDIEAKLAIICVHNKVDFNLAKDQQAQQEEKPTQQYMLNLPQNENDTDDAPAWVKAVRAKG